MTVAILPALWRSRSKDWGLICSKRTGSTSAPRDSGVASQRAQQFQLPVQPFSPAFTDGWTSSLCCKAPQDRVSGWSVLILFFSSIVQFGGFFVLVVCCCTESLSCSMQDLQFSLRDLQTFSCGVRPSSPARDRTRAPCIGSTAS